MRPLSITIFITLFFLLTMSAIGQNGILKGNVKDAYSGESLPFANVLIDGTNNGVSTDMDGNFLFESLEPGLYSVIVSFVGYNQQKVSEILVTNTNPAVINVELQPSSTSLDEVVITTSSFTKNEESPISVRNLGIAEIERNPGGNRDISKVLQSLPGVAQGVAFRNDLIIRGGGPGENKFFLEDVETPNINHFATQGASGGPVGMLDVNYIREVDFYSGAFPSYASNALSSVLRVNYKEPRDDRLGFRLTLGASDFGAALEGPIGDKASFFVSYRRSYLQFLFKALDLPFLPIYNDLQYKIKYKPNDNHEFYTIFLGAYDDFELNLDANETRDQKYILSFLPVQIQHSYTNGYVYKYYNDRGYTTVVYSRNLLNNTARKYENNQEGVDSLLLLDYESREIENKFRVETTQNLSWAKLNAGVSYEFAKYSNYSFNQIATLAGPIEILYNSKLSFHKWGFWAQLSRSFLEERLSASLGIRSDAASYSRSTANNLEQLSPRFSLSFSVTPSLSINFNTGTYYQLPPYTVLGYRDNSGVLVNRQNDLKYINATHVVAGIEWLSKIESRITVEAFYKHYRNYPFDIRDSVSLANFGSDFGVVGNVPADSRSQGRSYGLELMYQQRMYKGFYGIAAFTMVRSEFRDKNDEFVPSRWDSRFLVSVTAGKRFKRNWEVGAKWRFSLGTPYTPFDLQASALIANYTVNPTGVIDYNRLNELLTKPFHSLDIRVDKKFYWNKLSLNLYFDVQNVYNFVLNEPEIIYPQQDADGNNLIDPNNPNTYLLDVIDNPTGNVLPTFGFILEY